MKLACVFSLGKEDEEGPHFGKGNVECQTGPFWTRVEIQRCVLKRKGPRGVHTLSRLGSMKCGLWLFKNIINRCRIGPERASDTFAKPKVARYSEKSVSLQVQTGLGRTGKMLCSEWDDCKPDLVVLGKALSGVRGRSTRWGVLSKGCVDWSLAKSLWKADADRDERRFWNFTIGPRSREYLDQHPLEFLWRKRKRVSRPVLGRRRSRAVFKLGRVREWEKGL